MWKIGSRPFPATSFREMCFLTKQLNQELVIRRKMNEEEGKNEGKEKLRKEKNKESAKGEGRTRSTEKQ